MKQTSIEKLFEEYGARYRAVNNCWNDEPCSICKEDRERMQQIIKEITTKIEENVLREVMDKILYYVEDNATWYNTNNQIPNSELGKSEEHWEILQGVAKDSVREVANKTINDIKSLAESKNIKL